MLKNLFYKLFNKSSKYRQNVGIIIMNGNKIWSGHRIDRPSDDEFAWQMPQGGIDRNEDIMTASYREALEETGIKGDKLELIKVFPETTKYIFSKDAIKTLKKRNKLVGYNGIYFKGQEQHWVIFNFTGTDNDINLKATNELQEFDRWKWSDEDFLLSHCVDFKREVYQKVFSWIKKLNLEN